ncbi:hypothetical protein QBC47DRAFT_365375 [Echria macrotheca]|uniref:Uncharacterized protein n=1 Tax=Echria macrotheca TaxID=438768 RepID=A0AAJ0F4C6_9PEZI|nr:hypothetical protein QBC47DRAFT_365375 [Echria macrotheca]
MLSSAEEPPPSPKLKLTETSPKTNHQADQAADTHSPPELAPPDEALATSTYGFRRLCYSGRSAQSLMTCGELAVDKSGPAAIADCRVLQKHQEGLGRNRSQHELRIALGLVDSRPIAALHLAGRCRTAASAAYKHPGRMLHPEISAAASGEVGTDVTDPTTDGQGLSSKPAGKLQPVRKLRGGVSAGSDWMVPESSNFVTALFPLTAHGLPDPALQSWRHVVMDAASRRLNKAEADCESCSNMNRHFPPGLHFRAGRRRCTAS